MNRKKITGFLCVLAAVLLLQVPAFARWTQGEDGSWVYTAKNGRVRQGVYFPQLELGIAKVGRRWYCYDQNSRKVTGLVKNGEDWYFFDKKGRMAAGERVRINRAYYYFGADGKRVRSAWVGRRFYKGNGKQVFNRFVGPRYVDRKGKYVKGLQTIGGVTYYFDPDSGFKVTGKTLKIGNRYYTFDAQGAAGLTSENGVRVESSYATDPKVSDEDLLAAIIYCEAGNQPYDGQLAVGIVITNRVRSPLFPNTIREVVYAADQFQPCRNSTLNKALTGEWKVTESCRKAAHEVLVKFTGNNYRITNAAGKSVSLKNYLFFMTKGAYRRLGLTSKKKVIWDHVFFREWRR